MNIETELDASHAAALLEELTGVIHTAEPGLTDDEVGTLVEVAEWIEDVANVETGEKLVESPATGETYKATQWIERDDGRILALEKQPVNTTDAQRDRYGVGDLP
jgi:hypothetical protein